MIWTREIEDGLKEARRLKSDLIILSGSFPLHGGLQACLEMKRSKYTQLIPVLMLLREGGMESEAPPYVADATLRAPLSRPALLAQVEALVSRSHEHGGLVHRDKAVAALVDSVFARDLDTRQHLHRVANLAPQLARAMGLSAREERMLSASGALHDVGKAGVREEVLLKRGPLTPQEYEEVKDHTLVGEEICLYLDEGGELSEVVKHHHERWDGQGYPNGLKGEEIPLASRLLAVVDTYDAIVGHRPYREARPPKEAIRVLLQAAGTQFDPRPVEAFIAMIRSQGLIP